MKKMKTTRMLIVTLFFLLVTPAANAQFKKLLKNAKEKAQSELNKFTGKSEENAADDKKPTAQPFGERVSGPYVPHAVQVDDKHVRLLPFDETPLNSCIKGPDYTQKFTPSAAAIAADPNAQNTTVEKGFNKSIGEIHATYEHLDGQLTALLPYYDFYEYYRMDTDENNKLNMNKANIVNVGLFGSPKMGKYYVPYHHFKTKDGKLLYIPMDEGFRHAWTMLFLADPTSLSAFKSFAWVVLHETPEVVEKTCYYVEDLENAVVSQADNAMLPGKDFFNQRWNREKLALELARTVTNYEDITKYACSWLEACRGVDHPYSLYFQYRMGKALYDMVITQHKDHNASNPTFKDFENLLHEMNEREEQMEEAARIHCMPTVDLPKDLEVSTEIRNKATAAAKDYVGDKFHKVIFLTNKWETFKEMKWPYRITGYRMRIAVITKENGKYWLEQCDLQKSPEGTKYYVMAGMGGQKQPVKME